MAEYQYDPSTGSASEVTRGGQESTDTPTPIEEINRHRVRQTAKALTDRPNHTGHVGDTGDIDTEIQLQQTQQKLSRREFSNVLEEQQLIQRAESLAARAERLGGSE